MDEQAPNVLNHLYIHHGIDLRGYRPDTLERRLLRRLSVTGCADERSYLDYLKDHPEEVKDLIDSLTIKVSSFFRDPAVFILLEEELFPALAAKRAGRGKPYLSIWSAGCARGQEVYSLAMVLHNLQKLKYPQLTVRIVGTDVERRSLAAAAQGFYLDDELKEVKKSYIERYFKKTGGSYQIAPKLRNMVTFGYHNLMEEYRGGPPEGIFSSYDLIMCRNVLIYYQRERQAAALTRLVDRLNPGGYLVLGRAESLPRELNGLMSELYRGTKIFYKKEYR